MTSAKTLYADLDDVLCETARGLSQLARRDFGWNGAFEDIHSFDLGTSFALTHAQVQTLMDLAHRPEVLLAFEPVPGAADGLKKLAAMGYEITICTGRPPDTRTHSIAWLRRHGIPFGAFLIADKYGRIPGGASDGVVSLDELAGMDFRLAIEDAPVMVRFFAERTEVPLLVFDRPWNAGEAERFAAHGSRITRCRDWEEVVRCAGAVGMQT